jgi:hypothetical protein
LRRQWFPIRGIEETEAENRHRPVHAGHADAVVAHRADGAGHVGAMIFLIHRVAGIQNGVEAVAARGTPDCFSPRE